MPYFADVRHLETICPAVPRPSHKAGGLLHSPGGPTEWPEEASDHGLQDGSQV